MTDTDGVSPATVVSAAPAVARLTAPNPGPKTLDGTHTYVVGRGPAYVVDPGPEVPDYQEAVAQWLHDEGLSVRGILLTHGHPDHAPGAAYLQSLLEVPIWASDRMPGDLAGWLRVNNRFHDGDSFTLSGEVLRVVATPGHVQDHVAFWLEASRILFSGDAILGQGSTLIAPPDGDMQDYLRSLQRMKELRPRLIAPGHGPVVRDPTAKIEEYVRHRREREEQILRALDRGPAGVDELVRRVYVDVDPRLHRLARGSVEAQLAKLLSEGRVAEAGGRFLLGDPSRRASEA